MPVIKINREALAARIRKRLGQMVTALSEDCWSLCCNCCVETEPTCCEGQVADTLTLSFDSPGCAFIDGTFRDITGGDGTWSSLGSGEGIQSITLTCVSSSWSLSIGGYCPGGIFPFSFINVTFLSVSCDPFEVEFTAEIDSTDCCDGETVTITITE